MTEHALRQTDTVTTWYPTGHRKLTSERLAGARLVEASRRTEARAELRRSLEYRSAFRAHPTRLVMRSEVAGMTRLQGEIHEPIVGAVPVDVMDLFIRREGASDGLFHDVAMFHDVVPGNPNAAVPGFRGPSCSAAYAEALNAANGDLAPGRQWLSAIEAQSHG